MLNRNIYERDPKKFKLENNGVAKVRDARTEEELKTLRFELETFICEGQYEKGLIRLLRSYLDNLSENEQPAAWISGFFGSGKSHLIKMLRYLWIDYEFPDGATARGIANLSDDVEDLLRELSSAGQRYNGLQAVSGTLGSGAKGSVRLALLSLIFRSVGLPEQYPLAQFVMWLKSEGMHEELKRRVEEDGREWREELNNLMVSPVISKHLLDLEPSLGEDVPDVRALLRETYPKVDDVSLDQMVDAIYDALATDGHMPCTLVALDEIQQYIGQDTERTYDVQEITQALCSEFQGKVLLVATGQTALQGAPELAKLKGRFSTKIQLSDADVQNVTRKTVLKKKASARPDVDDVLTRNSGEISRHLSGTEFAEKPEDEDHIVDDYPILPTRRRFWERVLRAVDEAGTQSQLRTQLQIVDEAVKETEEDELGTVVPGDFLFQNLRPSLLRSDVLTQDIDNRIEGLRSDGDELGARLSALAFLIGKLPREEGADTGLRATPEAFADLLVEDLEAGSGTLRQEVEDRLDKLVEEGILMEVDGEYRMQTLKSQEWMNDFRRRYQANISNREKLASLRSDALRTAASGALDDVKKIKHGESNQRRTIKPSFSRTRPEPDGEAVPVWVQNGWESTEKSVEEDAREAGTDSPMVFVYLPKYSADELDEALATEKAAQATLDVKGHTTTQEGREARQAMKTRKEGATEEKKTALSDIIGGARVFLAGGQEYAGDDLPDAVQKAAQSALDRLYPKFDTADDAQWGRVLKRAQDGDADALEAIGFRGNPEDHPVCNAVLEAVSSLTKGREVREKLTSAPHGWPQDAVDASLLLLTLTNHVRARHNGQQADVSDLNQRKVGKAKFRAETVTLSHKQVLEVRHVLDQMTDVEAGNELQAVPRFVERVKGLADRISGAKPLPKKPDLEYVEEIERHSGNEKLAKVHEYKERLLRDTGEWQSKANRRGTRENEWSQLRTALRHASGLDGVEEIQEEVKAIKEQRSLLDKHDPVKPLLKEAADLLRDALSDVHDEYERTYDEQLEALQVTESWRELDDQTRESILARRNLDGIPEIEVGTIEELLDTLSRTPLDGWEARVDALPQRFDEARSDAVKELEPDTTRVRLSSRVLKTEEDVEKWLEETRTELLDHLEEGPVQV